MNSTRIELSVIASLLIHPSERTRSSHRPTLRHGPRWPCLLKCSYHIGLPDGHTRLKEKQSERSLAPSRNLNSAKWMRVGVWVMAMGVNKRRPQGCVCEVFRSGQVHYLHKAQLGIVFHGISTIITNHPFSLDWMDSVSWHHMKPTAFWKKSTMLCLGFPGDTEGKEPAGQYRRPKRYGFRPWIRKAPGGGHGSPLQYSCLENPTDRGAWRATVHRLAKSWTRLKRFSAHAYLIILCFKKNYSLLLK